MADIVQSLFGVTPELYQQAQAQRAAEQALQYAQLSPFQQANFAIGRGAYQLAGALGGTDPQLQMISTRNSIARQINYNDPNSIMQGVQRLNQAGDTVGAMQLADVARKMESEIAQRNQRLAAAKASEAQAAKDQAELADIAAQRTAFERLYPTAAAAPAAAPAAATVAPEAAAPEAVAPGMRFEDVSAGTRAGIPIVNRVGVGTIVPQPDLTGVPLPPVGEAPMPSPAAAAPAAPAPAAAPAAPAQTRATLAQQIASLESQRGKLLALTKVPAAKAQADVLGEQIKDLRSQLKPTEIANLEREIDQFRADGVADTDPRVKNRLDKIAKLVGGGAEQFGVDRESIALEIYDKPYAQLTQPQRAVVNKRVQEEGTGRAKASAAQFVLPGDKQLADIPAFRKQVQATIEPQLKAINSADQALQAINDSLSTGNFVSFNAARVQLAKSLGDSQLSRRDVEQAGGDPSILGGLFDATSRLFSGTPTADTQKKIRDTLTAIRTVAARKGTAEVDAQRRIALSSPGYNREALNIALDFPELRAAPGAVGGGSLAERAAAELARRKEKK
jgi:hypothetical protein